MDNTSHEAFTVISLEVQDYPGAPRTGQCPTLRPALLHWARSSLLQ